MKIYERRGAILHSKTVLVDGVWATVGSTNLDWRSLLHNCEWNAVVLGAKFGSQLQACSSATWQSRTRSRSSNGNDAPSICA